jgi:hypothetical protein
MRNGRRLLLNTRAKLCPSLPMYHVIIVVTNPCTRWQRVPKTICLYEAVNWYTHASAGNIASVIAGKNLYLASRNANSSKLFFNEFSSSMCAFQRK